MSTLDARATEFKRYSTNSTPNSGRKGDSRSLILPKNGGRLAAIDIVLLFFGQRIAKDYAGAAALVPYFLACVVAVYLLGA